MEVYLDNSATTRCYPEVARLVTKIMCDDYGNPSSMHMKGVQGEHYIRYAREVFAKLLKVQEKEIFFTSGGTESDNLAIIGCAGANVRAGKHLITTKIEHPAVLETFAYLEKQGYEVTYLGVDGNGVVCISDVEKALRPDTILVSIMHTNNEVGSLQHVEEIGSLIKKYNPKILFHVDAVQGYGKFKIYPKKMGIDLMSMSAHKIHGLKGAGALYVNSSIRLMPAILGGGQENGLVSGTEAMPAICAFAAAVNDIGNVERNLNMVSEVKEYFIDKISELDKVYVNSPENSLPYIINISVEGVPSQVMLNSLSSIGIYVSAGSACAKGHRSDVLTAMGIEPRKIDSAIRISLSKTTTTKDMDLLYNGIVETIKRVRR